MHCCTLALLLGMAGGALATEPTCEAATECLTPTCEHKTGKMISCGSCAAGFKGPPVRAARARPVSLTSSHKK
jgi:hypothetical protein